MLGEMPRLVLIKLEDDSDYRVMVMHRAVGAAERVDSSASVEGGNRDEGEGHQGVVEKGRIERRGMERGGMEGWRLERGGRERPRGMVGFDPTLCVDLFPGKRQESGVDNQEEIETVDLFPGRRRETGAGMCDEVVEVTGTWGQPGVSVEHEVISQMIQKEKSGFEGEKESHGWKLGDGLEAAKAKVDEMEGVVIKELWRDVIGLHEKVIGRRKGGRVDTHVDEVVQQEEEQQQEEEEVEGQGIDREYVEWRKTKDEGPISEYVAGGGKFKIKVINETMIEDDTFNLDGKSLSYAFDETPEEEYDTHNLHQDDISAEAVPSTGRDPANKAAQESSQDTRDSMHSRSDEIETSGLDPSTSSLSLAGLEHSTTAKDDESESHELRLRDDERGMGEWSRSEGVMGGIEVRRHKDGERNIRSKSKNTEGKSGRKDGNDADVGDGASMQNGKVLGAIANQVSFQDPSSRRCTSSFRRLIPSARQTSQRKYTKNKSISVTKHIDIPTQPIAHIPTHRRIHTYKNTYIHTYIHTYTFINRHKYVHKYIHTVIHTYIHTCTFAHR